MSSPPVWRRRLFFLAVAASPLLLVVAVGLDRSRGTGLDRSQIHARWQGRPERCLACHTREAHELQGAHQVAALGCSSCHLGNPAALDKDRAHAGLERYPGDFATLNRTCGRPECHPDAVRRVRGSLMGTARGLLSVDRYVFGETDSPDGDEGFTDLLAADPPASPAEEHARKLCSSCHLGTHHYSNQVRARGGGCPACHLRPGASTGAHPQLRLGVSAGRCTGCHARSGRISLSYYGWHEGQGGGAALAPGPRAPGGLRARRLDDGRAVRRARADVHADAGMTCLDCHTSVGLMGDGIAYPHEEQQVDIACTDCHRAPGARQVARPLGKGEVAERRIDQWLYGGVAVRGRISLLRTARGTPLQNLRVRDAGGRWLRRRVDGHFRPVKPVPADAAHGLPGHERLTCQACHTAWSHQCTGCHVQREAGSRQYDGIARARTPGRWVETSGDVRIDRPTLGVDGEDRIRPFLPGMPLCIGVSESARCSRWFAPADPHTTVKKARSCRSCHRSPLALGLGRGRLERRDRAWRFVPATRPATPAADLLPPWPDGVPWDGWTTLAGTTRARATRRFARPFSSTELGRILKVGPCLECHRRYDDPIFRDFRNSLYQLHIGRAPLCRAPPSMRQD